MTNLAGNEAAAAVNMSLDSYKLIDESHVDKTTAQSARSRPMPPALLGPNGGRLEVARRPVVANLPGEWKGRRLFEFAASQAAGKPNQWATK